MAKRRYHNTERLVRFILRRDRIRIPVWLIFISLITIIIAAAYTNLFSNQLEIMTFAETMKNPAMTAMMGPGYGLNNYTYGAMMAHTMLIFTAIAVALMSIFLVTRHTRRDEENGRIEVIRSLPVGRLSNITSTVLVSTGVNIVLALLTGLGLYMLGIESMDLEGSLLYGAALGSTGIFFTAITALFVQLTANTRVALGYSGVFLGLAYIIRAAGDVSSEALSWFSPLGWISRTQVYVNNFWWPLWLILGVALIVLVLAFKLNSIRDLEAGLIPAQPGRKTASASLLSIPGLVFRLQRSGIIAWGVGLFILGVSYGSVAGEVGIF